MEWVSSFKFLGVHITEDLKWSAHTDAVLKKAQQRLFFSQAPEKIWNESPHPPFILNLHCGEHPDWLHHCLVWKQHQQQSQSSTKGRHTVGGELPSLQDIYTRRCMRKPRRIISDSATQAMDCSLCCPQSDGYAVSEHAQAD